MSTNSLYLESNELKVSGNESVSLKNNIDNLSNIRERTRKEIEKAYRNNEEVLIEALPASGKTYGTFEAAKNTDTSILYLTSLNKLKKEAEKYCEGDLTYERIPVPHSSCPSFQGEHGEECAEEVKDFYRKGVSGRELHNRRDLPCGSDCPYLQELDKDFNTIDVLIGNPKHSYNERYIRDRIVVKDEFSEGEFETVFDSPREIINRFAQVVKSDNLPFDSYEGIFEIRNTWDTDSIPTWYGKYGTYRDVSNSLYPEEYHVHAPFLAYFLLKAEEVNEKWERLHLQEVPIEHLFNSNAACVRNTVTGMIYLLNPPNFEEADGFVGLDGTPVPEMWRTATGLDLELRQILNEQEKREYVTDILDLEIIQVNDSPKPYQNTRNVTAQADTALAYGILQEKEEKPGLITSKKALREYKKESREIFDYIDTSLNFAGVLSSNEFEDKNLGLVSGMRNYGDGYLEKWATYQNATLESNGKRWPNKEYTWKGETESTFTIHPYYRNLTLQDVFRFGRHGEEPTRVYVNTSGLPDWVPTTEKEIDSINETPRRISEFLRECEDKTATSTEIVEDLGKDRSFVWEKLQWLDKRGIVIKHESSGAFQPDRYEWCGNQ